MNITVYCGSAVGNSPEYKKSAVELGTWIGENGHTLVYGGGSVGLMGILADAVLNAGGEAIGITPDFFIKREVIHNSLSALEVVPTMSARRDRMLELGDAYIAMPGGIGTLDEISEALSLRKLGIHDKKCIFLNTCGFYDKTKEVLKEMVEKEFYDSEQFEDIVFAKDVEEIGQALTVR